MATVNVQMRCTVLLSVWVQFELMCDDPKYKYTVLMMPPSLSRYSLEG